MSDAGDEMRTLVFDECRDKMRKAVAHLQEEFGGIRTGRATPGLVEKIKVDAYGSEVPLQQLAGISVPEPRLLVISPYDKGSMKAIEKAIQASDLGINPSNDGQVVRLAFPALTEERRRDLVKVVKNRAEEGRVGFRARRGQAQAHHLGRTGAMKGLAERAPYAVGAAGDNHDFAGHLHRALSLLQFCYARIRSSTAV